MKNVMRRKTVLLLTAVALLLTMAVGGTIAYLFATTGEVKNTFEPAYVNPVIDESFQENVKKNVRIQNDGNVSAYIRVAVVGNWCDAEGNVLQSETVTISANNWIEWNGYYYYKVPVSAGEYTGYLIDSDGYTPSETPEGADHFEMEILAQAIQAEGKGSDGKHPVEQMWGVSLDEHGRIQFSK